MANDIDSLPSSVAITSYGSMVFYIVRFYRIRFRLANMLFHQKALKLGAIIQNCSIVEI